VKSLQRRAGSGLAGMPLVALLEEMALSEAVAQGAIKVDPTRITAIKSIQRLTQANFIGKFVAVLIIDGKVCFEFGSNIRDDLFHALKEGSSTKFPDQGGQFLVPKLVRYLLMDAFIPQDAHFAIAGRHVDEYSVSERGSTHAQLTKNNAGPVQGRSPATLFEMDADFPGALEFGLANALAQSVQVGL